MTNLKFLAVVKAMLKSRGLDVVTAENAQQALNVVEKQPGEIAVVLSDVRMPGMSGPQLVKKIVERSPVTAVALMSGDLGDEVLDPHISLIQKPVQIGVLMDTINELLERQKTIGRRATH
jgi:DNA-binding NtrC family response regulator